MNRVLIFFQLPFDVMVQPNVTQEDLKKHFFEVTSINVPSGKKYLRKTRIPT